MLLDLGTYLTIDDGLRQEVCWSVGLRQQVLVCWYASAGLLVCWSVEIVLLNHCTYLTINDGLRQQVCWLVGLLRSSCWTMARTSRLMLVSVSRSVGLLVC